MKPKDDKPAEAASTPPAPPELKPEPELTRVKYVGQTAGSLRREDGSLLVEYVRPGDVLEPETAKLRKELLGTGHFELTRSRASTDGTFAAASAEAQE